MSSVTAALGADLDDLSAVRYSLERLLSIPQVVRHRLLTVHVLPGLYRLGKHPGVLEVGGADNHAVQILQGQHIIEMPEPPGFGAPPFLDHVGAAIQVHRPDVADGGDLGVAFFRKLAHILHKPAASLTGAHYAD